MEGQKPRFGENVSRNCGGTKANRFFFGLVVLFFDFFFSPSFSPFEQILRGCFNYLISELVRPFLIRELIFGPRGPRNVCCLRFGFLEYLGRN